MKTIHLKIRQIIERSRREEGLLHDTNLAATDIITYLQSEKLIKSEAVIIKMRQTKIKTVVI